MSSRNPGISESRKLGISESRNLGISESRDAGRDRFDEKFSFVGKVNGAEPFFPGGIVVGSVGAFVVFSDHVAQYTSGKSPQAGPGIRGIIQAVDDFGCEESTVGETNKFGNGWSSHQVDSIS